MALATKCPEILREFDQGFYEFLTTSSRDQWEAWKKLMTWKYFLIGTTLPDLFWEGTQRVVRELIVDYHHQILAPNPLAKTPLPLFKAS